MIAVSLLALMLTPAAAAPAVHEALERAVAAELGRAKRELKDEGYPSVYHAALNIWDFDDWDLWGAMGAPRAEATMRQRILLADLRVGGPELDNHPVTPKTEYLGTPVSLESDEFALRHALWRVLDGSYKTASAEYLRKQAQVVTRGKAEYDTDDLAPEPPHERRASRPASSWDLDRLRRLEDAISAPFARAPWLLHADSHVGLRRLWTRRRDTDGSAVDKAEDWARVDVEAAALSPDGLRQTVYSEFQVREPGDLPTEREVGAAAEGMLKDLGEMLVAVTTSPFSAPALVDPSVSAALVFALGQRLSGEEQRNPAGAQTFRGRLSEKILPEELTLVDDPTQVSFRGRPLFGRYDYDHQGVPARRTVLVERGVLKGFLLSRYPVKGFARSNGHGRSGVGQMVVGTPGNLFLSTARPRSAADLLSGLRAECLRTGKPYGLWVRKLRAYVQQQSGSAQGSIRFLAQIFLVDAESGATLRVRDLDLVGTPLVMAGSILEAGDDAEVNEVYQGSAMAVVTPSLLLSDAELQRSETKPEKAPILQPPPR
ncbi:MAG: hypothetical protein A2506_13375 [Elusimicrobia bacterium RIFOXYD12_FULL_66_9]|nr:MAG: hypothetical protein A2506_13375 [Elusimicrobia bacterium RIFOXYD12_FULL_66_9]